MTPPQKAAVNQGPVVAPGAPVAVPGGASPAAIYRGLRAQQEILNDQRRDLLDQQQQLMSQLSNTALPATAKAGLERRITQVESRIADVDEQIAKANQAVAQAAAVPGAIVRQPERPFNQPDPDMIAGLSFVVVMAFIVPITIAFSRRIWRRSAQMTNGMSPEFSERLAAMERGLDAVALEVERISESQRFLTQTLASRGDVPALGAAKAEAVPVTRRD